MTANEWIGVMKQAQDFPKGMEKLIVKYGEMLIAEHESKVKKLTIHDVSNCPDLTNVWYKILEEHADDIPTRDKFCDALWMLEAGGFCQLKFAI